MVFKLLGLLGLAMAVACCTPSGGTAPVPSPEPSQPSDLDAYLKAPSIPFETVSRGSNLFAVSGGPSEVAQQVVKSESELASFLERRPVSESPVSLLGVDYAQSHGLIIVLEDQPTIDTEVDIVAVEEQADEFVVYPVKWVPRPGSTTQPMMGVPHHFIKTKPLDKPVVFKPVVTGFLNQRPAQAD